MPDTVSPPVVPHYEAGDILVAPTQEGDGSYQVSRVAANGHSTHVMSVQRTQPAALLTAMRATSGYQRVFLRSDAAAEEYRLVD